MKLRKKLNALLVFAFLFSIISLVSCAQKEQLFVKRDGKNFVIGDKPYYYIGANYWQGAILASKGEGGNRARLLKELDMMQKMGINNLRILAGAEGPNGEPTRVTPALQLSPGKYNDELLDGLDFLLSEMKKRNQYAILFINNAWEWSGGYAQYVSWSTGRPIPYPSVPPHTWGEFMHFSGEFINCSDCQKLYQNFVKFIISRTNKYTGEKYVNDPTIMTWEIANEPRAFSTANIPAFEKFIKESAAFIKSIDPNHLVTTGTEGQHGCEESLPLFERIHSDPNIDYLTMHIWPKNWGWLNKGDIPAAMDMVILNTDAYMNDHIAIARKLNKPLVLEEFGLPRDKQGFSPAESVISRDKFYENAFNQNLQHSKDRDVLAGCNFWSFSGLGRATPGHVRWVRGDELLGDPPQEEQGLNSVFDTDSTLDLVKKYNKFLLTIDKN